MASESGSGSGGGDYNQAEPGRSGLAADPAMALDPSHGRADPYAAPSPVTGEAAGGNRLRRLIGRRQGAQPDLLAEVGRMPAAERGAPADGGRVPAPLRLRYVVYLAVAAIALVLGLGFFFLGDSATDGQPVVIAADPSPEKVKPEEAGGLLVPNQDSTLLNGGGATAPGSETVLAPEEQPAPFPAPNAPNSAMEAPPLLETMPQAPSLAVPAPTAIPEAPAAPAPEAVQAPQVAAAPLPPSMPAAPSPAQPAPEAPATAAPAPLTPKPTAAVQPAAGGKARVQLAAVKSEAAARAAWSKLQKAHPALLGALSLRLEKVDKGAEGVFYRIQAGPLADRTAAKDLCARLKREGQACIVAN